jgi:phage head maturation protease
VASAHVPTSAALEAFALADDETRDVDPQGRVEIETTVQVRSATAREIDIRIMPWGEVIETVGGTEEFARGAFDVPDPSTVLLIPPEHERRLGLGHAGDVALAIHPAGRGINFEDRPDGAWMTFKVARTQAGDEILALAEDGITRGASVEFTQVPGGTEITRRNGRRHFIRRKAQLDGVTPTYRPAYRGAQIVAVRTAEGDTTMPEATEAPVAAQAPTFDYDRLAEAITSARSAADSGQTEVVSRLLERLERLEEQARSSFTVPTPEPAPERPGLGDWGWTALRLLTGDHIPDREMRTVADFITTDNAGIVPDAYMSELIGVIQPMRPFLESTRRVPTPASGTTIKFPKITQRPTTAVQSTEKTELSSTKTVITTSDYSVVSVGGYGDLSVQLLKRTDRSFLALYLELLAEAYATDCDDQALRALFDEIGGVGAASALDPEALSLGAAFQATYDAMKRPPDTIWLSTEAVGAFIDAKQGTGGANIPLYSNITANFTAGNAPAGLISGLRPVHVPALDAHGCFALVGPSRGFAWAEDGTYTLQVDVPAKAGRDVGVIGMIWPMAIYPDAFTAFNVAS